MKEEKDQALQGSAEPDVEHQDNGIEQGRAALAEQAANLEAQSRKLADTIERAEKAESEAAMRVATARASDDLKALGSQVAPAIMKAGAAAVLVALELGQKSAEINGESVDIRKAVLGLLGSAPDLDELGFNADDIANEKDSGNGPGSFTANQSLLKRHGITPERLEELQTKYLN